MMAPRRALVEIPAPQPKIAAGMRRSYLEILSSRLLASSPPPVPRTHTTTTTRRSHSLDSSLSSGGQWRGRTDEPRERLDEQQHAPLTNQQLARLIRSLILVEQSQEPSVLTSDLKYLQDDLQLKKANVFRSIPYSRLGSNRDAHCYRKAYPYLLAFRVSCQEWGTVLLRSGQWDLALEYGLLAWRYAGELPTWDTAGHNAPRDHCYAALAAHCLAALRRRHGDAAAAEPAEARELLRRLKMAQQHSRAIDPCIHELERILEHGGGGDSAMDTL